MCKMLSFVLSVAMYVISRLAFDIEREREREGVRSFRQSVY